MRTWEPKQFPGGQAGPKEETLLLSLGRPGGVSQGLKAMELWTFRPEVTWQLWPLQCTSISWEFWEPGSQHLVVKLE